jgi:lipoprotein NlpD
VRTSASQAAVSACVLAVLLAGCATQRTAAPVVERSASSIGAPRPPAAQPVPVQPPPVVASPSGNYQVKRGDTLYSIALDHGVDPRDVAQWNRLEDPTRLQPGQSLRVTPPNGQPPVQVGAARGAMDSRPIESRPLESRPLDARPGEMRPPPGVASGALKSEPKALRLPYSGENLALLQRGESTPPAMQAVPAQPAKPAAISPQASQVQPLPAKPAAEPRDADAIEFIWPARGKVLTVFSEPSSKGLDIGGKPGDPVVAAASGRVIYIGTGIRGYGKLIVIKHDNNFNSVYAHNREILVKQDQAVTRGQQIAELGDTDADGPKLHFEIRKSGKPVDPAKYLPPS